MVRIQLIQWFAAEATSSTVIQIASHLGIPFFTTHIISSSIMDVGATKLQLPHPPIHLAGYSHIGSTWMALYARAVEREVGLSTTKINKTHLEDYLTDPIALLKDQADFFEGTSEKSRNI